MFLGKFKIPSVEYAYAHLRCFMMTSCFNTRSILGNIVIAGNNTLCVSIKLPFILNSINPFVPEGTIGTLTHSLIPLIQYKAYLLLIILGIEKVNEQEKYYFNFI